jgi:hypothetical protein
MQSEIISKVSSIEREKGEESNCGANSRGIGRPMNEDLASVKRVRKWTAMSTAAGKILRRLR